MAGLSMHDYLQRIEINESSHTIQVGAPPLLNQSMNEYRVQTLGAWQALMDPNGCANAAEHLTTILSNIPNRSVCFPDRQQADSAEFLSAVFFRAFIPQDNQFELYNRAGQFIGLDTNASAKFGYTKTTTTTDVLDDSGEVITSTEERLENILVGNLDFSNETHEDLADGNRLTEINGQTQINGRDVSSLSQRRTVRYNYPDTGIRMSTVHRLIFDQATQSVRCSTDPIKLNAQYIRAVTFFFGQNGAGHYTSLTKLGDKYRYCNDAFVKEYTQDEAQRILNAYQSNVTFVVQSEPIDAGEIKHSEPDSSEKKA